MSQSGGTPSMRRYYLLMVVVGGVGTLFGAVLGSGLIELFHEFLSDLASATQWVIFERWIILFGLLYILIVMFFPAGLVGTLTQKWANHKHKREGISRGA